MKHVVFFVVLLAISIAKPIDESDQSEKSLQHGSLDVHRENLPTQTIIGKHRPLLIKSKKSKPKTKKRLIGARSKSKALVEPDSGKSAITFALDSDDKSLNSVISVILKFLEIEEQKEREAKKKNAMNAQNLRTTKIPKNPTLSTEEAKTLPDSKPNMEILQLPLSEQNHHESSPNTEIPVIQTSTISSQLRHSTKNLLDLDVTTTPSNIILEASVSFEPSVDDTEVLPTKPDASNDDLSTETDDDSKHYCPDNLHNYTSDTGDSVADLEKLIASSEQSAKASLDFSTEKNNLAPTLLSVSESYIDIQTETPTTSLKTPYYENEIITETESTTLRTLDIETYLSETTTVSSNILTDREEGLTSDQLSNLTNEVFSTPENQIETTTFITLSRNTDILDEVTTEQETADLLTTKPENDEKTQTTVGYNQILSDNILKPSLTNSEINKYSSNYDTEMTTILPAYEYTLNEIVTTTEQSVLITRNSAAPDTSVRPISSIAPSHGLSDKSPMTPESLPSESLLELSQYATTPITESRIVENITSKIVETDEKLSETFRPSTELHVSEVASANSEAVTKSQEKELISTPTIVSSSDMSTLSPLKSEKENRRENSVESKNTTLNSTKPHSRLITFTLYDRKQKYTSLKHFIDYLKTLKK